MATRFDRVTTPLRPTPTSLDDLDLEVRALARRVPDRTTPPTGAIPSRSLAGAMATWLLLVFLTCYVAIPLASATAGIDAQLFNSAAYSLPAFAITAFVSIIGALVARPSIDLDLAAKRDPVLSAAISGALTMFVLENTMRQLVPFSEMGGAELVVFVSNNLVETLLLGMMFASFTRSRIVAAALGAGFQLTLLGLMLTFAKLFPPWWLQ